MSRPASTTCLATAGGELSCMHPDCARIVAEGVAHVRLMAEQDAEDTRDLASRGYERGRLRDADSEHVRASSGRMVWARRLDGAEVCS